MTKVIVSYSRNDKKDFDQLRRFLSPLRRRGLLDLWDEPRSRTEGDRIDEALEESCAVVLLVSQDFLASPFITETELPRILAAAAERENDRELAVIPVYLGHSLAEELDISFQDAEREVRSAKLTEYVGYGEEKPLSELSWSDRERVYKKLALRLRELAGEYVPAPRPLPRLARPDPGREPLRIAELTVDLEPGQDGLRMRYILSGGELFDSATMTDTGWRDPLEAFDAAVSRGEIPGEGQVLFDFLFGPEERWGPLLRQLHRRPEPQPRPNPPWAPLRLRISTTDPLLLRLPWRLTRWNERLLAGDGWLFTTTHLATPIDCATHGPESVLIAAPGDQEHTDALLDLLAKVWPTGKEAGYARIARTTEELRRAFAQARPHILYVYGDSGAEMVRGLSELLRPEDARPQVLWLNTHGSEEPPELPELPLLIRRRLGAWQRDSTTLALAWFRRWLGEGDDPIAALHHVTEEHLEASPEAATLLVHSRYRTWKTTTYQALDLERRPDLRLDRDHQKALVGKHVSELARSGSRRVLAFVAYASPGNTIFRLAEQLRDYLDLAVYDLAEINWLRLELPPGPSRERQGLEHELRMQLRAEKDEPLSRLFRRYAPTVVGTQKRPLIWLDWGTFGPDHEAPLMPAELGDWLRFSSESLGLHCPGDLRIVSYLAIETEKSKHKRLAKHLQEYRREAWCRRPEFRLTVLPPLGRVSEDDLFDFLDDPQNSSCDPAIHAEVAERLIAETGGVFVETVALMREAEKGSWYDLLTKLRRLQGAESEKEDEEPF